MEFLQNNGEAVLTIVATIVAFVWSFAKGTDFWKSHVSDKATKTLKDIGEIAHTVVRKTYEDKVKGIKGKMTDKQKKAVRDYAYEQFKEVGGKKAQKWVKKMGEDYLRTKIEDAYNERKNIGVPSIKTFKPIFGE